jgi:hypothetical protein
MKWLRRRIMKWLRSDDWNLEEAIPVSASSMGMGRTSAHGLSSQGMGFVLYHASGGHVLECTSYDRQTDRHQHRLYIIREDGDFATQVAQCMTLEGLRR